MNPLVSILIPAYNAERWIGETLHSALAQRWPRKEIIVVDDGSRDGTLAAAQAFAGPEVRVVRQENAGAAAARNHAYALCRGDYIQWLDADDLLSPDKIAGQLAVTTGAGGRTLLSCGWGAFIYRPHKAVFAPTALWETLTPLEWMLRKWEGNLHMQTATWLTPRALADAAGPWDTRLLGDDDGEYFSRVIRASDGITFVPGPRVYYRVSGPNRLSYVGASERKKNAQWLGMKLQVGYLLAMARTPRARAAGVTYLQTWLPHFYPDRLDLVAEARELAAELGGSLTQPNLSWKYAWLQKLAGWEVASRVQTTYNERKERVLRWWDGRMLAWEQRRAAGSPPGGPPSKK